ncbi:uncharacterized protein LOC123318459 [Coccinella septempunctata]|uniref:uncharacterized protein LOC123318459 n=1 Tax=Coccinella septempunctata TaxID=41139 RepID=UPI001D0668CE|nr:uncharacterized protein LOC123318459 [Coccinella septempunctata]
MLTKDPKKVPTWFKRGAITLFVAETFGFLFCYTLWNKVNTDRDSRKYLRDNYPSLLDSYYKVGEYFDSKNNIRQIDSAYWNAEK